MSKNSNSTEKKAYDYTDLKERFSAYFVEAGQAGGRDHVLGGIKETLKRLGSFEDASAATGFLLIHSGNSHPVSVSQDTVSSMCEALGTILALDKKTQKALGDNLTWSLEIVNRIEAPAEEE